jgi:hypothetical protein
MATTSKRRAWMDKTMQTVALMRLIFWRSIGSPERFSYEIL